MPLSKSILLILVLVTAAVAIGAGVCKTTGIAMHTLDVALAASIGVGAAIAGLLPLYLRSDRTPVALFQSAWIGSILHMGLSAALGIAGILLLKLSTPFVVWLLIMYWITLSGLCLAFIKTMRLSGQNPAKQVTFG